MIRSARDGLAHAGDTEVYTDQAALEGHRATPHHAVWRSVAETLDGPPEATSVYDRVPGGPRRPGPAVAVALPLALGAVGDLDGLLLDVEP